MPTSNGTLPADPRGAAAYYLDHGRAPIPVPYRCKDPRRTGWQHLRLQADDLDTYFPAGQRANIGLLTGAPSNGLIDVDLDTLEAVRAAALLLPATGLVSGRASKPRSHWWYRVDNPPAKKAEEFHDLDGTMLLELRSTGGQTVVPPSVHEGGEAIVWHQLGEPAEVDLDQLQQAVHMLAAAAILARHWPAKGHRDTAAMALHGALLRGGWSTDLVECLVQAVAVAAGDDEVRMRARKAERTEQRLQEGASVYGWPKLAELVGKDAVQRARQWLGCQATAADLAPIIPEPLPWPDQPGSEAFHGLAGRIVQVIEPASEADRAALLIQTLVAFGSVIGRTAHFSVEADRHHGNEFAVLVGKTSKARKGTSWGQVSWLFAETEEQWANNRVQTGASSGEGIIWAVRDPIMKRERIKEHGEVRYEEVEADPGEADKRLLVYEPEFANVLKQTERQGNTLSAILRQAWDGSSLRTLTKTRQPRRQGRTSV